MRSAAVAALALVLSSTASSTASAQGWQWVSPKPQGVAVNAVSFVGSTGWYVGAAGTIATTSDGAGTFTAQSSGTTADLYGVYFQSATVGWAVGDLGTILATQNGGNTWVAQASGSSRLLRGVWFTDALHGFAVGDFRTLLQTADGGQTWTGRGTSALSLDGITFTDALHGFMCGDGGLIVLTADGGNTFTTIQTASAAHLLAIAFADALHGFAVGEGGAVVATSDGGQSWTAQTIGTDDLVAVLAASDTQVYALGSTGNLYATSDGSTWAVVGQLTATGLFTALVQEPVGGALDATAQSGQWLRAAAGGTPPAFPAFQDVNTLFGASSTVSAAAFGSVDAGVLVVNEYLYATSDRGAHFQLVGPPSPDGGPGFGWLGVSMPSATDVYAVGIQGTAAVSHDVGQTWTLLDTGDVSDDLEAVQFFPDSGTGFAVGENGTIVTTANGGSSWIRLGEVTSGTLTGLAFLDPQHGVIGGEYGTLLYTVDGQTFQPAMDSFYGNLTGLAYPAQGLALACASDGTLEHTTSQGLAFYSLAAPAVAMGFGALAFSSRQNGWLAGNGPNGDIWVTSDGAQSFGRQFSSTASILAFSFVDAVHGYAVGANGTVLTTATAGGPSCQSNADCADAGYAGIACVGGACLPCTTDDRCGPTCTACPTATPYCYGGYCGACESDAQCLPGYCSFGQCQTSSTSDGGTSATTGSTATGGTSSTGATTGHGSTTGGSSSSGSTGSTTGSATGGCLPGDANCEASSGCGCGTGRGGSVWAIAFLLCLALGRGRPRLQG